MHLPLRHILKNTPLVFHRTFSVASNEGLTLDLPACLANVQALADMVLGFRARLHCIAAQLETDEGSRLQAAMLILVPYVVQR